MNKKLIIAVLVLGLSVPSTYALGGSNEQTDGQQVTQETQAPTETQVPTPDVLTPTPAPVEVTETPIPVVTTQTPSPEATITPTPVVTTTAPPTVTEKPDKDKKDKDDRKKAAKERLKKKIEDRKEKRTEAKEFIKDIKKDFKDADPETKKEILAEIAKVKKELKDDSIGVFLKGDDIDFDKYDGVKPVIKDGRTLVPVRAISEGLGAKVDWTEETKTITITKENVTIIMQLDNKVATVNGVKVMLDVAPATIKDRTMVPLRFILETFKLNVDWHGDSQTVVIEE